MIQPKLYRFSIEEYEQTARTGVWDDRRVELLDGEVFPMTPIGPEHSLSVIQFIEQLVPRFKGRAVLAAQNPLHLPSDGEPEPDIMLLKPPKERYQSRLPTGEDVLLLIEVSKSTLEYDRSKKLPIYARANIPEVWIHNLADKQLEVYRNPQGERYTSLSTYAEGQEVAPSAFGDEPIQWWA